MTVGEGVELVTELADALLLAQLVAKRAHVSRQDTNVARKATQASGQVRDVAVHTSANPPTDVRDVAREVGVELTTDTRRVATQGARESFERSTDALGCTGGWLESQLRPDLVDRCGALDHLLGDRAGVGLGASAEQDAEGQEQGTHGLLRGETVGTDWIISS